MQYKYETPKILRSIFSTDSCLQSDNGASTSKSPPARKPCHDIAQLLYWNIHIPKHIPKYQNTTEFFFTQIWKTKTLQLQKHSNPFVISANTPMAIKPKTRFSIFLRSFESNFVNPDEYKSENSPKKHKIENQKI